MNLFRRAVAGNHLLSSPSSSRKCLLVLHLLQQPEHPTEALQNSSSQYSTTSKTSSLRKQQQERNTTNEAQPQHQQSLPSLSRSCAEAVQKQTLVSQTEIELEKGPKKTERVSNTDWPRPREIPWQVKVANSVHLIGHVQIPVQFEASQDGKYWAGTVISQRDDSSADSPPFWIPVIFEGDLAHIAACHLKANDYVYIAGQLSADPPPFAVSQGQANVQVMVRNINFVKGSSQMKKAFTPHNLEERDDLGAASMKNDDVSIKESWDNPITEIKLDGDTALDPWRDLIRNPQKWWDHRENKRNGLLKPKHPDFKHKNSGIALWLNNSPKWVLQELDGLEFDVQVPKVKQAKESKGNDSWKNLVEDPDKWWDNRTKKFNPKAPDFRHKITGEGLWLSESPAWAISRLPPMKAEHTGTPSNRSDLLSETM